MTPSTEITRLREKASSDRAALDALLDSAHIGHFGLVGDDGTPVVIPTAVVRDGDRILLHGSTGSPWLRRLADGAPTSLAVTAFDGLVIARSAFESSIHYRSAVLFGTCTVLADEEKVHALDLITQALVPGRVAELRRPRPAELAATLMMALPITRLVAQDRRRLARGPRRRRRRRRLGRRHPRRDHLRRPAGRA